ncbi:unnamed protein product [Anisakis simplex]|uniref:Retrovirus-related Pol polyprotein from transposon TNT 1-94 n=1 Tax=Anisakis simplex TaxID=6269 RepID=A0A0M3JTB9_ANISI|nr:unnamed protein product [Anisakis simplex]
MASEVSVAEQVNAEDSVVECGFFEVCYAVCANTGDFRTVRSDDGWQKDETSFSEVVHSKWAVDMGANHHISKHSATGTDRVCDRETSHPQICAALRLSRFSTNTRNNKTQNDVTNAHSLTLCENILPIELTTQVIQESVRGTRRLNDKKKQLRYAVYTMVTIVFTYLISNSLHLLLTTLERSGAKILVDDLDAYLSSNFYIGNLNELIVCKCTCVECHKMYHFFSVFGYGEFLLHVHKCNKNFNIRNVQSIGALRTEITAEEESFIEHRNTKHIDASFK